MTDNQHPAINWRSRIVKYGKIAASQITPRFEGGYGIIEGEKRLPRAVSAAEARVTITRMVTVFNDIAQIEEWRSVVGFEGFYEVSNIGRVRRIGKSSGAQVGHVKKQSDHAEGYKHLLLYKHNHPYGFLVHCLVAQAFIGVIPDGYEVNHIDGNKHNNRVDNLEILSGIENVRHGIETGLTKQHGQDNGMAVLTNQQALEIRQRYIPQVMGYKRLAKAYGVRWEIIRNIVKGNTYAVS